MSSIDKQPYEILPSDDVHLWRYMSIPKFLSLIQSSQLYFHRADKFRDIYEGSFTQGSLDEHMEEWDSNFSEDHIYLLKRIPNFSFVSCWHMSKFESAALWEIYGTKEGSVAIQTTVGALRSLFPGVKNKNSGTITCQQIIKVQYIDYKANKRGQVSFRSILPLTIIPTPRQSPTRGHNVLQFPGNHMLQFGMPK